MVRYNEIADDWGCLDGLVFRRIGTNVCLDCVVPPHAKMLDGGLAGSPVCCRSGSTNPETVSVEVIRIAANAP